MEMRRGASGGVHPQEEFGVEEEKVHVQGSLVHLVDDRGRGPGGRALENTGKSGKIRMDCGKLKSRKKIYGSNIEMGGKKHSSKLFKNSNMRIGE